MHLIAGANVPTPTPAPAPAPVLAANLMSSRALNQVQNRNRLYSHGTDIGGERGCDAATLRGTDRWRGAR